MWLALATLATADYEAPQIWAVDGVSLAFSRTQLESSLGPAVSSRPLKASWGGERWEYTYRNGLKAAFVDQDRGRHPSLLVGRHFTSRGLPMIALGQTRAQVEARLGGAPTFSTAEHMVYEDPARRALLSLYFEDGRLREVVLSRFRIDSSR